MTVYPRDPIPPFPSRTTDGDIGERLRVGAGTPLESLEWPRFFITSLHWDGSLCRRRSAGGAGHDLESLWAEFIAQAEAQTAAAPELPTNKSEQRVK